MDEKKTIFFVGKTLSHNFIKIVEEHFHIVKSLSKKVSIIVYVPETKGSKTQLEKCKDWNLEKITYDQFCKKYINDNSPKKSHDNYDNGVLDSSSSDDETFHGLSESAFRNIPDDDDSDNKKSTLFGRVDDNNNDNNNNNNNRIIEIRQLMYQRHINSNMIEIFEDNIKRYKKMQKEIEDKLSSMINNNDVLFKNM